jgi:hypothetical protein
VSFEIINRNSSLLLESRSGQGSPRYQECIFEKSDTGKKTEEFSGITNVFMIIILPEKLPDPANRDFFFLEITGYYL